MIKTRRVNAYAAAPEAMKTLLDLDAIIRKSGLPPALIELVKLRASQINGCAFCVDLHSRDARAGDESERRLHHLPVWRDSPLFAAPERAALAWTEALTRIADGHPEDELYADVRRHFDDGQIAHLTALVGLINAWNRLATSLAYEVPAQ